MADNGKTEKPTGKRLADAKEKGDVARSPELSTVATLFASLIVFAVFTPYLGRNLIYIFKGYIGNAGEFRITMNGISIIFKDSLLFYFKTMVPLFAILLAVAVLVNFVQGGGIKFVWDNLKVNFKKFNIAKGLKKIMFSSNAFAELIKALIKVSIIGVIAYRAVSGYVPVILTLPQTSILNIMNVMGEMFLKLAFHVILFMIILSVLDYLWQKYQYIKKLKMSKNDIKDEYKQLEGDPKVKSKRRQIQMQQAMNRMMAEVPKADVIITNPTHYAVAIKYVFKEMDAPKVVAKGKDLVALKIREKAKEAGVPVVENPPLARAVYGSVDIDGFVPGELFKPVAEILAYVYRLKGRKLG